MPHLSKKQKKLVWIGVLVAGLILEVVFIAMAIASAFKGKLAVNIYQAITFIAIAVWIYIAYLKQRSMDISTLVVDEKVKTHMLIKNLKEGVIIANQQNNVLAINARACELSGLDELDALGKDLSSVVDNNIGAMLAGNQNGNTQGSFTTSPGKPVRVAIVVLQEEGDKEGFKLLHLSEAPQTSKTEFMTLPDEAAGGMSREAADCMQNMACELGSTIRECLDESRIPERARCALRGMMYSTTGFYTEISERLYDPATPKTTLNPESVLKEHIDAFNGLASHIDVSIDFSPRDNTSLIETDAQAFGLALDQILLQAILSTDPDKEPVIAKVAPMGENLGVSITDHGPAIDKKDISQLFRSPYKGVRNPEGTIVRTDGTGYELARTVVEAMGGTLITDAPPEGGLRIAMMLPSD